MVDVLELAGARAIFSTRNGGVSDGPYRSLNLGILTDDEPSRVVVNRTRLAAAARVEGARGDYAAYVKQQQRDEEAGFKPFAAALQSSRNRTQGTGRRFAVRHLGIAALPPRPGQLLAVEAGEQVVEPLLDEGLRAQQPVDEHVGEDGHEVAHRQPVDHLTVDSSRHVAVGHPSQHRHACPLDHEPQGHYPVALEVTGLQANQKGGPYGPPFLVLAEIVDQTPPREPP